MKRLAIWLSVLLTFWVSFLYLTTPEEVEAHQMEYRVFFQTVSTYDDGAQTRWTGCVNLGGTCWSEESVVADCSWDGGTTWKNCNSNVGLAGTGG